MSSTTSTSDHGVITDVWYVSHDVTWRTSWDTVRVTTADGSAGIGELSDAGTRELSGRYVSEVAELVVGLSADEALSFVGAESERLSEGRELSWPERRLRLTVLGGFDAALCDLVAACAGIPLPQWYGRSAGPEFPCYANLNRALHRRTPDEFARVAKLAVASGFTAVKCAPFDFLVGSRRVDLGLRLAAAVREAIGDDVELRLDLHKHVRVDEILASAPAFAELRPAWIEDATDLSDVDGMRAVRESLGVPIAGGEFAASKAELEPALSAGVLDIVTPDVKHAGGPRRALELARFATSAGAQVSLHNPTGPVSTAHSLAVSWQVPACGPLELAIGEHDRRATAVSPEEHVRDGMIGTRPGGVGLGHELSTEGLPMEAGPEPRIEFAR
ncbi:mandelate racemase/muconate lactonizing enzyme family protein [Phytoactinopolyspora endophytica]|uniref:mandelate racemase/muconate lactonizing enzyme family protein n=1 Tax=Phytoactinopolyspora endophytica TaxID=1642495 RepID=UPI0013EB2FA5|nr:mandelate racemase/muconate lactonizing enzyme family protein [Phytoactinopolyspora endophytica]